jgi:hypothetical protein
VSEFPAFRKIPRLYREVVVTEKIDGTNGLLHIERRQFGEGAGDVPAGVSVVLGDVLDETGMPEFELWVRAGSRKRWITPQDDNFGFAGWVSDNAFDLARVLGEGHHYGEWWGAGIQRRYGRGDKTFSLFNTSRWTVAELIGVKAPEQLSVVPVLSTGIGEWVVEDALAKLRGFGSYAASGFDKPEGVVVYHTAANAYFKVTLEDDQRPKAAALAAPEGVAWRGLEAI